MLNNPLSKTFSVKPFQGFYGLGFIDAVHHCTERGEGLTDGRACCHRGLVVASGVCPSTGGFNV